MNKAQISGMVQTVDEHVDQSEDVLHNNCSPSPIDVEGRLIVIVDRS